MDQQKKSNPKIAPQAPAQQPAAALQKPQEPEEVYLKWNAPEFTYTNKPMGWYLLLALFFIGLIILAIIIRQWITIALFAVMWIALVVYARRKPRVLTYLITNHGIHVGEKNYDFDRFSAYTESSDYGQKVFDLNPIKRFAPLVSLPVPIELEPKIDAFLLQKLPKTEKSKDVIDKLSQYLKF